MSWLKSVGRALQNAGNVIGVCAPPSFSPEISAQLIELAVRLQAAQAAYHNAVAPSESDGVNVSLSPSTDTLAVTLTAQGSSDQRDFSSSNEVKQVEPEMLTFGERKIRLESENEQTDRTQR
jgi:hypothetical protein